jgi:dTDP-glucose 4,6-dehydratase
MKLVITGGAGFVGHHLVEHFLKNTDWEISIFDRLSYSSKGLDRVRDIDAFDDKRVTFFAIDLTRGISEGVLRENKDADYILHLAAESHVDKSIEDPKPFVYSNVVGTMNVLDYALKCDNLIKFNYFSTDEVFGPAPIGVEYKEWDRYNSTNPYSASKAGGEELTLAYMNTYGLPGYITHTMNIFGERQHPEKFIPKVIRKVRDGECVTIHSDPTKTQSGSRFYIHARNLASATHFLLDKSEQRDKYNIVGEQEITNLELAQKIADIMGKDLIYEMMDFHSARPGHDLRYALDGRKMEKMGWKVPLTIDESLEKTVKWTLEHEDIWLGGEN